MLRYMALSTVFVPKYQKTKKVKTKIKRKKYQKKPPTVSNEETERQIREYAKKKQREKQRQNMESGENE